MPSTAMMVVIDAVAVVITGAEVVVTISSTLRAAMIVGQWYTVRSVRCRQTSALRGAGCHVERDLERN